MIAISFGQACFNTHGEQQILLVTAPRKEYPSMDEFVSAALDYLESDGDFADEWPGRYGNRAYSEARADEVEWMMSRLAEMSDRVSILHGPVARAVHVVPPEWNDITLGLETPQEYIFCQWSTSA